MVDGAFEVAFKLPTTGASNLKYVRVEDGGSTQQGYILSVMRAGLGVSGALHEILDLVPKPDIRLAYRKVGVVGTFVVCETMCLFPTFVIYNLCTLYANRCLEFATLSTLMLAERSTVVGARSKTLAGACRSSIHLISR